MDKQCCENCKYYSTMPHDRMGFTNDAPYHICGSPKQATYPDDIRDYSYEYSNGGKDCPYYEIKE